MSGNHGARTTRRHRRRPERAGGRDHAGRAGRSVLVLEARGARRRRGRHRGAYAPGLSARRVLLGLPRGASPRRCSRAWPLERHGLRWVHPATATAHPLPDGRAVVLYRDLDATAATLDALQPGRRRALARLRIALPGALRRAAARRCCPASRPSRGGLQLLTALGLGGALDFARLLLMPASALAGELFNAEGSRAWLYGVGAAQRRRRREARAARSRPPTSTCSATRSAGRAPRAAPGSLPTRWPAISRARRAARAQARASHGSAVDARTRQRRRARRRREIPTRIVIADVMPHGLLALARRRAAAGYAAGAGALSLRPRDGQSRLGADGPIPWTARRRARPARCTSAGTRRSRCGHGGGARRAARAAVPAARPADDGRPDARPGRQAHRLGLHAWPAGLPLAPTRLTRLTRVSSRRSSASRRGSATASWRAT